MVFKNSSSAVALKYYLNVFDLKMHGYLASEIFGVSVLATFGAILTEHPSGSIILIIMRKEATF